MAPTPQTEQVFLSYSRNDRDAAIALRSALDQINISVFRDEDAIRTGDNWLQRLQDALQGCAAFIVLIGRDGVRRWLGAEVQVALVRNISPHDDSRRLPIFPVLLPGGDAQSFPPFLNLYQLHRWQPDEALPQAVIQAIRDQMELLEKGDTFDGCPFLGLSTFQPEHAHLFFGRRKETLEALKYLGTQGRAHPEHITVSGEQFCRWLQIEGNSGGGKSSLVNAGMLPLIQQGALWARTGYENWHILGPMMPGETPLRRLAEVLEHALEPEPARRDSLQRLSRLEHDDRALSFMLNDHKDGSTAFLLVVDQFEELFTFSLEEEKQRFGAQLAEALTDRECPLFLISTVRIDFLDGFERLGKLSELYNDQCKRYLLKTISQQGMREVIEQPARLAGLDVSEITTAILGDTENEVGALPLVENALHYLWEQRRGNSLSGELYREKGRLVGLLETQADSLLDRLDRDKKIAKGREGALELLLALTRINPQGSHTRQRISLQNARHIAGDEDERRGQKIIDYLAGKPPDSGNRKTSAGLRLITTIGVAKKHASADAATGSYQKPEYEERYVDLIHETLIRARPTDKGRKLVGYWQTLYDYIDKNRDRLFYRDQLQQQAATWQESRWIGRWWHLAGWRDLRHLRKVRPGRATLEGRFLRWSRRAAGLQVGVLAMLLAFAGESYLWTLKYGLSPGYMLMQQRFRLMQLGWLKEPLPLTAEIPASDGEFQVGELDEDYVNAVKDQPEFIQHFGIPTTTATIAAPFGIGKYEVSYEQYDYYVWQQRDVANPPQYPNGAPGDNGRNQRAVVNVSWTDVNGYLRWLSNRTGEQYRLPTEAEWEYAARAGSITTYWWGDEAGQGRANCNDCGSEWDNKYVAPIGSFAPNAWGLHDTAGNVWEWTCSEWKEQFDGSERGCVDPADTSGQRVLRGGSWINTSDLLRSSSRFGDYPNFRYSGAGFRVLRAARTN